MLVDCLGSIVVLLLPNLHFAPIFGGECPLDNRAYFRHYQGSLLASRDGRAPCGSDLVNNKKISVIWTKTDCARPVNSSRATGQINTRPQRSFPTTTTKKV